MKNKRIIFVTLLFFAAASIAATYFYLNSTLSPREAYTQFLLETYETIPDIPEEDREKIPKLDRPDMAAFQNYLMILDPKTKQIPPAGLHNALLETERIAKESGKNTEMDWTEHASNMGGRSRVVVFDPNDDQQKKVWAGAVTGGLWYNNDITNETENWQPVSDLWENMAISSIVFDPVNPQTMYVGTGEAETAVITYRSSSGRGVGIWKSTDGGESWELLPSTEGFAYVTSMVMREEDGQSVLYAGVTSGTYGGEPQTSEPDGLFRSTDGGDTWTQVLPLMTGSENPLSPADIALNADSTRIFVGTRRNLNDEGGARILYSDDGENWTLFDDYVSVIQSLPQYNIPGRVMLAEAPSNPEVMYAIIGAGLINGFHYFYGKYILRSDDKGETWTELSIPESPQGYTNGSWATLAWHAFTVGVDPNDENTVFVGGLDLYRTTDGGTNWERLSDWWNFGTPPSPYGLPYLHADQHAIVFRPGSSDEVLFTNDGGVFYTDEATAAGPFFQERNNAYNTLQYYTCAVHPQAGTNTFMAGAQDNGTFLYGEAAPITRENIVSYGDGAYCFIDSDNPDIRMTTAQYTALFVSTDGGANYEYYNYDLGLFINPMDYEDELNILYCNAVDFFGNYAGMLYRIKNMDTYPYPEIVDVNTGDNVAFSHLALSPHAPEGNATLYLGTQAGRLFKAENIAQSSTPDMTEIGAVEFPAANISSVAVGGSEDTLLVTFSNYGVSSIWQTTDGGENWQEREGNLPDMPVRWAVYHPETARGALIATETGVWRCDNLLAEEVEWLPQTESFPKVRVDMLRMRPSDNRVVAATHGRGLFSATYIPPAPPPVSVEEQPQQQLRLFPNPATDYIVIQGVEQGTAQLTLYDTNGKIVARKQYQNLQENAEIKLQFFDFQINNGIYFLKTETRSTQYLQKILIQK